MVASRCCHPGPRTGIIAAILIPRVLLGLGFLATQVVDPTQFGVPPVQQILPIKR